MGAAGLAPKPGETVLDLGSGGGIDVLLSTRRVGPGGKAYGLDITDEMLALARENQLRAGIQNAEFLKRDIENIPLPDNTAESSLQLRHQCGAVTETSVRTAQSAMPGVKRSELVTTIAAPAAIVRDGARQINAGSALLGGFEWSRAIG